MKFLAIGGGNDNGQISPEVLDAVIAKCPKLTKKGYDGICFDIEYAYNPDASIPHFMKAFDACKEAGLQVMVTMPHSAPLHSDKPGLFLKAFLGSPSVDIISPQLYSTGHEEKPQFAITAEVKWPVYKNWNAMGKTIIPSLVRPEHFTGAQSFFRNLGVEVSGYIMWEPEDEHGGSKKRRR